MAHKGQGSTKNGRILILNTVALRSDGMTVSAGSILVRQVGTKIHPGVNVGLDPAISRLRIEGRRSSVQPIKKPHHRFHRYRVA